MTETASSNLWQRLTSPHLSITTIEQRRQSKLLASLMIVLGVTSVAVALLLGYRNAAAGTSQSTVIALLISVLFLLILFALNRSGRYQLSANLFVLQLFAAIHLFPLATGDLSWLFFGSMVMILGAILLSWRGLLVVFFGSILVQIFLGSVAPGQTTMTNFGALSIFFVTAPLVLVFLNHRNGLEAERQAELQAKNIALRETEASLERRVAERTRDLGIALKQAEEANTVKSQFLASTSHELRTPLNAIINFGEFLQQGMLGEVNDEQIEASGNIISSGRHLLALINDVLDISKIEAGALQLYVEDDVNLNLELTEVLKTANTLLKGSAVKATLDIPQPLPMIRGDRIRIRQILLNLVSNACKFTEQGTITVRARQQNDNVVISVADSGPGIRTADFETIFETFRQTEVGIRKGKGTGLGLPIARRLAEAHGGTLLVDSTYGQGATFTVTIPVKSATLIPSNVEISTDAA